MGRREEFFRFAVSGEPAPKTGADVLGVVQSSAMREYMDSALTEKAIPRQEDVRLQNKFGHDDDALLNLNSALRQGAPHEDAAELDNWVSSQKTTRPISTYRGLVVPKEVHENWVPGSKFIDKGFAFTSPYKPAASLYGQARQHLGAEGDRVILQYDLPAGHPATNANFGEMVLPRETEMSVVSRKTGTNGTVHVVLRHPDLDKDT